MRESQEHPKRVRDTEKVPAKSVPAAAVIQME